MPYLIDTNVLLRLVARAEPLHPVAVSAIHRLQDRGEELFTTGQNFIELWNVVTRPSAANGLEQAPQVAARMLLKLEAAFPRLDEPWNVYDIWRDLAIRFAITGVKVHDTRLVAVMLANDVADILTFNTRDFRRFHELEVRAHDPRDI